MFFYGIGFPDGSKMVMFSFFSFNDKMMTLVYFISFYVACIIFSFFNNKNAITSFMEHKLIEVVWTIMPTMILMFMAFPSLKLLYFLDCNTKNFWNLIHWKVMGHQWYWSYECKMFDNFFDSFMMNDSDLELGFARNLEVDMPIYSFYGWITELTLSSSDVIHSFSLPTLGMKCDAVPGRLKTVSFLNNKVGVFYGQCSEICGANHSFMPLSLEIYHFKNKI